MEHRYNELPVITSTFSQSAGTSLYRGSTNNNNNDDDDDDDDDNNNNNMFYQGKPFSKSCYKWVPWATKNNK